MKLSVELFHKTVDQMRGGSVSQRPEKRLTPRVGLRCRIQLHSIHQSVLGQAVEAWTRDISRVGLGAMCGKKMKIGNHYLLKLPHEDPSDVAKSLALYCTVRSCQELTPGVFAVGFSFEDLRTKQVAPAPVAAARPIPSQPEPALQPADEERIRQAILD